MTGNESIVTLLRAIDYIVKYNIPGDMVECGVWKGGSIMAMALKLIELADTNRNLYLYDTFEGMPAPEENDIRATGQLAIEKFKNLKINNDSSKWCYSSLEEVKENVYSTNYPKDKIHFIKGKVEVTIPNILPQQISLLRLDTDWYKSTKHELIYLYPKVSRYGIIIIDDYGTWMGAKQATDEFIKENDLKIFLHRIDKTARIAIKNE